MMVLRIGIEFFRQSSDTESCEMLQEIIDEETDDQYVEHVREYNRHDDADLVNSKTINDILKYGAGHHSMDSNPGETQSEWSDEDDKDDDAKGELFDNSTNSYNFFIMYIFNRRRREHWLHHR